jgi:hypothetical protein
MTNTLLGLLAQYWYIAIVAMFMVLLSIAFLVQFVLPAIRLSTEIDFTNAVLKDIRLRTKGNVVGQGTFWGSSGNVIYSITQSLHKPSHQLTATVKSI